MAIIKISRDIWRTMSNPTKDIYLGKYDVILSWKELSGDGGLVEKTMTLEQGSLLGD